MVADKNHKFQGAKQFGTKFQFNYFPILTPC